MRDFYLKPCYDNKYKPRKKNPVSDRHFKVSLLPYTYKQEFPDTLLLGPSLCVLISNLFVLVPFWSFLLHFYSLPPPLHSLMSSTSSSSSSSTSSTSTPDGTGNAGADIPGPSTRRTGDFEGPSSSRQRVMNEVLPEPVVELLATQVAIDAAHYNGRLAAAPALAIIFQVPLLLPYTCLVLFVHVLSFFFLHIYFFSLCSMW